MNIGVNNSSSSEIDFVNDNQIQAVPANGSNGQIEVVADTYLMIGPETKYYHQSGETISKNVYIAEVHQTAATITLTNRDVAGNVVTYAI